MKKMTKIATLFALLITGVLLIGSWNGGVSAQVTAPDCVGNGSANYGIPSDNPFVDGFGGVCDEIWATGLRNPWRFSFDRVTGDMWIGDVGQNAREEINFQAASSTGGEDYGWRCYEGIAAFNTSGCSPSSAYVFPIWDIAQNSNHCSVIGGFVYRGATYPDLVGKYVASDYCSGDVWLIDNTGNSTTYGSTSLSGFGTVAFGEDNTGEMYAVHSGTIYKYSDPSNDGIANPTFTSWVSGLNSPIALVNTNANDDSLFVVEQGGRIKIVETNGTVLSTPFLNLSGSINSGSERGLLGLAFDPSYDTNGFFYVNYTNSADGTRISRFQVNLSNPNLANPSSEEVLITIPQPLSNHNAGDLKFGPDGYLYIPMGDGGGGGDGQNNAQNDTNLLGTIIRIDVSDSPLSVTTSDMSADQSTLNTPLILAATLTALLITVAVVSRRKTS